MRIGHIDVEVVDFIVAGIFERHPRSQVVKPFPEERIDSALECKPEDIGAESAACVRLRHGDWIEPDR